MNAPIYKDYIIIGAGPAGVQLGYYLEKSGQDYIIFERGESSGETFKFFPRHRTLISINKRFTGHSHPDFNMRHDWNSLLCDDNSISFRDYDTEFFPHADSMVSYINDYTQKFNINVLYNIDITTVEKNERNLYVLHDSEGRSYVTRTLIVATGFIKPLIPEIPGIEMADVYPEMSVDRSLYENKRVLVIGKGNSGFETADHLVSSASLIHVASPNPLKMAWKTHYVGHLRAVNNNLLDTYQLKSQNAVLDVDISDIKKTDDGRLAVTVNYAHAENEVEVLYYDKVLLCTGFRFDQSIFDDSCRPETTINNKYPKITSSFESVNNPNMFFMGTITHSLDYKKATSGFIHGFRYNARALFKMLNQRYNQVPLPRISIENSDQALLENMLDRINHADGIWQQPGFLADVFLINDENIDHICELPMPYIMDNFKRSKYYVLTLEYGAPIEGDPFNVERIHRENIDKSNQSQFLHPVIRFYDGEKLISQHDIIEDLEANWTDPEHIIPLQKYIDENGYVKKISETTGEEMLIDEAI
ncbi:MAG: NAD(P)-binding domain-containing protein [Cellvibrionaceae bacterium]